jgi:NitT/TauT family transport system substrate-binding protein
VIGVEGGPGAVFTVFQIFHLFGMRINPLMTCAVRRCARDRVKLLFPLLLLYCSVLSHAIVAAEPAPVRIGLTREASTAPLLIAINAGYFKTAGLNPQLAFFDSDASVSAAVASGKVDIGMAALSAAFYRYAAAHRFKIVASRSSDQTGFPMYALLISKAAHAAGFSGVRGLPNTRIGVADAGSGEYYGLYSIASRFKLDSSSIKTTALKSPAGELSALSRGDIEAAILPFATALHAARNGRSLLRLSDFAEWQQGVVFTSAETITIDRTLMERFMRAYQRGTTEYALNFLSYDDGGDFIPGSHYDQYLSLIARQVNISSDTLARTKTYCDRRANLDVADIEKQVQFWQNLGRVDKSVVAADLLDLSFIGEDGASATGNAEKGAGDRIREQRTD